MPSSVAETNWDVIWGLWNRHIVRRFDQNDMQKLTIFIILVLKSIIYIFIHYTLEGFVFGDSTRWERCTWIIAVLIERFGFLGAISHIKTGANISANSIENVKETYRKWDDDQLIRFHFLVHRICRCILENHDHNWHDIRFAAIRKWETYGNTV